MRFKQTAMIMPTGGDSGGATIRNQDKTITENGTYTADNGYTGLGKVTVNVVGSGGGQELLNEFIDGEITEINSPTTSIRATLCQGLQNLRTANFPNATSIGDDAFRECKTLTTANFPMVTTIGDDAFYSCEAVRNMSFPSATTVETYVFSNCKSLESLDFPLLTTIGNNAFRSCEVLSALILRKGKVCTLNSTNALTSTLIASGTGYIYVPSALVEQYKLAKNWSTYASQIRAIEEYTVDGTVTGELDETKI